MKKTLKKILVMLLCWNFSAGTALAAGAGNATPPSAGSALSGAAPLGANEFPSAGTGSEFVSGNFPGAVLIPVNLWGSIAKPGIHYVPKQTDLITLLSLAGGPGVDAQLDGIVIKRRLGKEEQVLKVDGEQLLTKAGVRSPVLEANDIVLIPRDKPPISTNTLTMFGFVSTVLSIVITGYAVSKLGRN